MSYTLIITERNAREQFIHRIVSGLSAQESKKMQAELRAGIRKHPLRKSRRISVHRYRERAGLK